ncbi:MAG: hypothetical protein ACOC5T_10015 [Elusimicrobiota bacterium]
MGEGKRVVDLHYVRTTALTLDEDGEKDVYFNPFDKNKDWSEIFSPGTKVKVWEGDEEERFTAVITKGYDENGRIEVEVLEIEKVGQ